MRTPSLTIQAWLHETAQQFREIGIISAYLDAEIILAHTLHKNRIWLHAHADDIIPRYRLEIANTRRGLRRERIPIAYIIGHKEFYSRLFYVTPSVLIPRPESEAMIEILKELPYISNKKTLVDIGTGSGCLGITAKLELPYLNVTLADISVHALAVAKKNAAQHNAKVATVKSNVLNNIAIRQDIIIANLPYVDKSWERSPETNHEPDIALFSKDNGLHLIKQLIRETRDVLSPDGYLLLEADPIQHSHIISRCRDQSLKLVAQEGYTLAFVRT